MLEFGLFDVRLGVGQADMKVLPVLGRGFKHRIGHDGLAYRTQAASSQFELDGLVHDVVEYIVVEGQFDAVEFEEFDILFDYRIFGLGEYHAQGLAVERVEVGEHREPADDFRNEPVGAQVLRCKVPEQPIVVESGRIGRVVTYGMGVQSARNAFVDTVGRHLRK